MSSRRSPACWWPLSQLPGLSATDLASLQALGITDTRSLLHQGADRDRQRAIAAQLRLHEHHVRKWIALADLARIPSVGLDYCGLLLHAGIISTAQLAQQPAHKLHQQILRLQVRELQRRNLCPPLGTITQWILQARELYPSPRPPLADRPANR
ncbi:MAG: DUF4332 domain-containing protein [Oscillatoriales cyanobacterium]|nr:MAG: DUF4332 domain-containing protein [Oscillatoriales cyanobacterium]